MKKFIWIVAMAFSLVLCQSVFAECGEGLKSMIESLKLDDAQKEKIKPVLEQLKSSVKDQASQMMDISKQINQQATSATMDQATVDSLIDKKVKMLGDMIKAKITAKNQIFAVLTEEQKSKLQTMMKTMEDKMAEKWSKCRDQE